MAAVTTSSVTTSSGTTRPGQQLERNPMLNKYARFYVTRIMTPTARAFLRVGITPDAVTIAGTLGLSAAAMVLFTRGELLWGTLAVTAFVFSDSLDGVMARLSDRQSSWGAFLDSVLDRVGDAALFGSLAYWFAGEGDHLRLAALFVAGLGLSLIVSYVRAKAESLDFDGRGGVVERPERLVLLLVTTGVVGLFDLPLVVLEVVLWVIVTGSVYTIVVRIRGVRRQAGVAG